IVHAFVRIDAIFRVFPHAIRANSSERGAVVPAPTARFSWFLHAVCALVGIFTVSLVHPAVVRTELVLTAAGVQATRDGAFLVAFAVAAFFASETTRSKRAAHSTSARAIRLTELCVLGKEALGHEETSRGAREEQHLPTHQNVPFAPTMAKPR